LYETNAVQSSEHFPHALGTAQRIIRLQLPRGMTGPLRRKRHGRIVAGGEVLGHRHTIQVAERLGAMGDLADLGLDEQMALSTALTSSASDRAIALTWPMAPRAVDDAQESPSGR
jgi:hypothetical protein